VVAAGPAVDSRRAAEFAGHHDDRIVQAALGLQIFDQGPERLVERRQLAPHLVEVVPVRIPAAPGEGHASDAGRDQPPGHEEPRVLAVLVDTIPLAIAGVFFGDVQRPGQFPRGDEIDGPLPLDEQLGK